MRSLQRAGREVVRSFIEREGESNVTLKKAVRE